MQASRSGGEPPVWLSCERKEGFDSRAILSLADSQLQA